MATVTITLDSLAALTTIGRLSAALHRLGGSDALPKSLSDSVVRFSQAPSEFLAFESHSTEEAAVITLKPTQALFDLASAIGALDLDSRGPIDDAHE